MEYLYEIVIPVQFSKVGFHVNDGCHEALHPPSVFPDTELPLVFEYGIHDVVESVDVRSLPHLFHQ